VFGVQVLNRLDRIAEAIGGKTAEEERLWCARGEHYIGNEPYTFAYATGEPVCLRCVARIEKSLQERIGELEEKKAKEIEWDNCTEDEREMRRAKAKASGVCPRCNKPLTLKGSCPMCCEYPFRISAPMNRVWREREWESLSESEKQARIKVAQTRRDANLSEWATKGDDGIWRRKDDQAVVERAGDQASLVAAAKGRFGSEY